MKGAHGALVEIVVELTACARLAESIGQNTDQVPSVICETAAALSRTVQAACDRLMHDILPACGTKSAPPAPPSPVPDNGASE